MILTHGLKTVLTCLLWYLVSSVTSQLSKVVLVKFTYPLFLGQFQFLIGCLLSFSVITIVKSFPESAERFPPGSVPDNPGPLFRKSVLVKILPLGLFQFLGKFFSLSATSLIPLATVSSIKALSPLLIVLGYRVVYHVKFPFITYLSLTPLVAGVILIIYSDSDATSLSGQLDANQIKGIIFCVVSAIIFASQNIYGKQLITWDSSASTAPASLVLNTELSRPGTPVFEDGKFPRLPDLSSSLFKPKQKSVRQRNNSIKLPYSTSDLKLDEKNQETMQPHHDTDIVDQNNVNFNNPFASFVDYEPVAKPDKMTIIFYCSMVGFVFSLGGHIFRELPEIIGSLSDTLLLKGSVTSLSDVIMVIVLIALDSLSHFIQTLLAFHLLGSIPTLSYSIASMMKRIVLITVSIVLMTDPLQLPSEEKWFGRITSEQAVGLGLIAVGLYAYDRWGSRSLKGLYN